MVWNNRWQQGCQPSLPAPSSLPAGLNWQEDPVILQWPAREGSGSWSAWVISCGSIPAVYE